MKKQKLNLNDLKVESFITSLNENISKTINGGVGNLVTKGATTEPSAMTEVCGHCSEAATACDPDGCPTPSGFYHCTVPGYGC